MDSKNQGVKGSSVFNAVLKVLGPALLGFGTIFQPKTRLTDHWSDDPNISIEIEVQAGESGNPPKPDADRWLDPHTTAAR